MRKLSTLFETEIRTKSLPVLSTEKLIFTVVELANLTYFIGLFICADCSTKSFYWSVIM